MILRPEVPCRLMQDEDPAPTFPYEPGIVGDHSIACWGQRLEGSIQRLEKRIDKLVDAVAADTQTKATPPFFKSRWGKVRDAVQSQTIHDDNHSLSSNQLVHLQSASTQKTGESSLTKNCLNDVANGTSDSMPKGDVSTIDDGIPLDEKKKTGTIALERKAVGSVEDATSIKKSGTGTWNLKETMKSMRSLRGLRSVPTLTVEDLYLSASSKKHEERGMLESFVTSAYFDAAVSIVVVFNALMLGVQVNQEAEHGSAGRLFSYIEYVCTGIFTCELAIRLCVVGLRRMCTRTERLMTTMDIVLVVVALTDAGIDIMMTTDMDFGQSTFMVRLIKVLRMGRLLRPLRTVALLGELRVIAQMIVSSFRSLFWLMCILAALTYCFALVLTQGAATYFAELQETGTFPEDYSDLKQSYGNVPKTMYSLFLAMTGGRNWGEIADLIAQAGVFYGAAVVLYVFVNLFSVLNIVTGVFVDGAIELAKRDRHMMIEKSNVNRDTSRKHLVSLLTAIDRDGDGCINKDEFFAALQDGEVQDFMDALGIDPDNAAEVFMLLDSDSDGVVNVLEFIQGMEKVRGEAKSVDIQMLKLHSQKIVDTLNRLQGYHSKLLARTPVLPKRPICHGRYDARPSTPEMSIPGLFGA